MARLNLLALLSCALAAGVPAALADHETAQQEASDIDGGLDGCVDCELSDGRGAAIWSWLTTKVGELRTSAEMRQELAVCQGESPEPLPEWRIVEDMSAAELAAEVRSLANSEGAAAEAEAAAATAAAESAGQYATIAEDVEEVIADVEITAEDKALAQELVGVEDPLADAEVDLVAADEELEDADADLVVGEIAAATAGAEVPDDAAAPADEAGDAAGAGGVAAAECGSSGFVCEIAAPPKVMDEGYNPADVDWAGLIQTVKNICAFEPRFCTFCIRTFFHDSGSFTGGEADAADASIVLNDLETFIDDNTNTGFAPYARAILAHLGAFYGCSAADLLTVAAVYGPIGLGADLDPSFDNLDLTPVYVGRIDHPREATLETIRGMHAVLPTEWTAMPAFVQFWVNINDNLDPPPTAERPDIWNFNARDIIALMGAHTLMDNHGCQEQECGGEKKMFVWNTDWYRDMNSGSCTPRKPPPLGDDNVPLNADGGKGRTPNAEERRAMRECAFKSEAGLELSDNLQCQIDDLRGSPEADGHQAGFSFQFSDWRPTESRGECCGDPTCDPCPAGSTEWWCDGADEGTVHWPYPWADCEMAFAFAEQANGRYCESREGIQYAHEVDCSEMAGDERLVEELAKLSDASNDRFREDGPPMVFFEDDLFSWTHYFYKGMNKLSALGATWGNNPRILNSLVDCGDNTLCAGEPMTVPDGLCPPLAAILTGSAAAPNEDIEVEQVPNDGYDDAVAAGDV